MFIFNLLSILFWGFISNQPLWMETQLFYLFGGSPSDLPL